MRERIKSLSWRLALAAMVASALLGCDKYKKKIRSQSDEIDRLTSENAELKASNESLVASNSKLESDKEDSERSKEELEAKIGELEEQIKTLEEELSSMGIRKSELSKDLMDKDAALKELERQQALARKRLATLKNVLRKFKSLISSGKLNVKIRRGKMVLELPSAVLFESGKAELSDEGKDTLKQVADVLAKFRKQEFQISGHTDNVPIKSSNYESNWDLSTARALTVVKYLQDNKVSPKVMSAAGYSEYQPAGTNATEEGKAANRRIEIVLMPDLAELPDLSELEKELSK